MYAYCGNDPVMYYDPSGYTQVTNCGGNGSRDQEQTFLENQEANNMNLDIKQINNLCTGVKLATELISSNSNLRKFLTIRGYSYNDEGKVVDLSKFLNKKIASNIYFVLRCYEVSVDYYINDWDVTEDELINEIYQDDINGIEELESELIKYIQDFSVLKPEWYCENIL